MVLVLQLAFAMDASEQSTMENIIPLKSDVAHENCVRSLSHTSAYLWNSESKADCEWADAALWAAA